VDKIERRKFLKVAGAGVAGAAAVSTLGPLANLVVSIGKDGWLRFRAVTGLPSKPLPAYASYVLEGQVDLAAKSGTVTRSLYAGAPDAMSAIAFPGLTRTVRVTSVEQADGTIRIKGSVDDRSQLLKGETATVEIRVDRPQRKAWAQFFGTAVTMELVDTTR
jgi:hypothetical protein